MRRGLRVWLRVIGMAALGAYLGGALVVARDGLSGVSAAAATLALNPVAIAPAVAWTDPGDGTAQIAWGSSDRVSILLLATDAREDQGAWPGRSDVIAVATLDPKTKTAGLISFPRDLWVWIPHGPKPVQDRLNEAFFLGEIDRLAGGGPELTAKTLDFNFGIRTNYWAVIDFNGFINAVDALGGVTVDVPTPLKDNEYPTDDYGYKKLYFAPGIQHLDGRGALEYSRSRHQDSDLERNARQQQMVLALRDRALSMNVLSRLPILLAQNRSIVQTNMPPSHALALARVAWGVERESITLRSLDRAAATPALVYGGAVLLPNRRLIMRAVSEVFLDARVRAEAATIAVVHNPRKAAQARALAAQLDERGFTVRTVSRPDLQTPPTSALFDFGRPSTAAYLAKQLNVPALLLEDPAEAFGADIVIVLGDDNPSIAAPRSLG